ncbi:DNA alkylation repair protein [Candidatus Woesearchaeota archaeon]|nr:DNA alkylation repair protein [Candidatus Woesearchaeota archaeon]
MNLQQLQRNLQQAKNPFKAKILQSFFKTGTGQYGEGDIFLGIVVPEQRKLAKKYPHLTLEEIQTLLKNNIHEYRFIALLILINQYKKADNKTKQTIFNFYLNNTKNINNWDLVDLSAPNIIGNYLLNKDHKILYALANSPRLWEKRISIIATFEFIRNNQFEDILKISKILLNDQHDLIHKAVGWMLRELGKRNQSLLEQFLQEHYKTMPRTMLRYAIEKLPEEKREYYLQK